MPYFIVIIIYYLWNIVGSIVLIHHFNLYFIDGCFGKFYLLT